MTIQAITRRSLIDNVTFTGKPSKETTEQLRAAGFDFDRRSRQWFRVADDAAVMTEQDVVAHLGAA